MIVSQRVEAELLLWEVKLARRFVLNAFAHRNESTEDELSGEVGEAIQTVKRLEIFLLGVKRSDFVYTGREERASVGQIVLLARRLAIEGRKESALGALLSASEKFVREYLTLKSILFRADDRIGQLWGQAFPKDSLGEKENARLRMIKPYFLGHVTPKEYDPMRFEKASEFLIEKAYGALIRILRLRMHWLDGKSPTPVGPP